MKIKRFLNLFLVLIFGFFTLFISSGKAFAKCTGINCLINPFSGECECEDPPSPFGTFTAGVSVNQSNNEIRVTSATISGFGAKNGNLIYPNSITVPITYQKSDGSFTTGVYKNCTLEDNSQESTR